MRIVLIGAGNLATQLGMELKEKRHQVMQVYSRTAKNAQELASKLNCAFTDDLFSVAQNADLYIIAVSDNAIEAVLSGVNIGEGLVVHTAGAIGIDIFTPYCKNFGVLYPLQTFSKQKKADFSTIPFCIEANSGENLQTIKDLAESLSKKVFNVSSEQRLLIHLAAVFACNFVNHFYVIAEQLLRDGGLDFDLVKPLILETASKVVEHPPKEVQTGPAKRNDSIVMEKHLKLLENHSEWSELYKLISSNIYHNK